MNDETRRVLLALKREADLVDCEAELRGDLPPDRRAGLEARSAEDPELQRLHELSRPLPASTRAAAEALALAQAPGRRRAALRRPVLWIPACAAAALALALLWPPRDALPSFTAVPRSWSTTGSEVASADAVAGRPLVLTPGQRFRVRLQPAQQVRGPLRVQVTLVDGARRVPWNVTVRQEDSGVLWLRSSSEEVPPEVRGAWTIELAIDRPERPGAPQRVLVPVEVRR